jgi:hypothetical protein
MLDLPDDLLSQVQLRASRERQTFDATVAELLRKALSGAPAAPSKMPPPTITTDPKTGLPVIAGAPDAPISRMTTEEIYALIHATQEEEDLERLGVSLRR